MDNESISAVKIPPYNAMDPSLWFHMCQATFQLASPKAITDSKSKFNYVVANLPPTVAAQVRDIIMKPDATDPYEHLKTNIISRCGETKSEEIRRLLQGEQLGDRKPSELLRVMQRRAENHNIEDNLLLELFIQHLPVNVQSILASIMPVTPLKAAEVADRILEVSPPQVNATTTASCSSSDVSASKPILQELKELRQEVERLRRSRSTSRTRRNFRFRSRPKSSSKDNSKWCWYHTKFQEKAKNCSSPCSYPGNAERQE